MLGHSSHAEDVVIDRVTTFDSVGHPNYWNLLRQRRPTMAFGDVRAQVESGRELLSTSRLWTSEVLGLLVLVENDLVVECFVAKKAKRLHV